MSTTPTTNLLSMNVGGVNVQYDLGPSVADQASAAYTFLENGFNEDSAFVQNAISGSQSFLSGITTPIINDANEQQTYNDTTLGSMFNNLNSQNFDIGEQAINADTYIANASIAASQASAQEANSASGGGGGLCYITTAVCETFKLPDDCATLKALRRFRDTYMQETPERRALVRDYYETAPAILSAIRKTGRDAEMLQSLYVRYIKPACACIAQGRNARALDHYAAMVNALRGGLVGARVSEAA